MANEQHRAQRIQSDFQKLLAELKKQDEEVKALQEQYGVGEDAIAEARRELEPPPRRHESVPLQGFVVRG